jgi:LCP family protein required for cell wall assembly
MSRRNDEVDDTGWSQPRGRRRGQKSRSRRSRRPRHSLAQRVLAWTSIAVVGVLVAGTLVAYAKYRSFWDSIKRVDVAGLVGPQPPKLNNSENILLIGSDTRVNQKGIGGSAAANPGGRSDTLMLLHISPRSHEVTVVSIPRETMVPILSCPAVDGTTGQQAESGQEELINATLEFGGPVCTWKTFEQETGIHLDHFIELDFTGFENIINDLHGVEVCLPFSVDDLTSGLDLTAGRHHIYGHEALAFWRTRENLGEGSDTQRIVRDQFLMVALVQGIEHSGLLRSPTEVLNVIRDATDSMTVDEGFDQNAMLAIADTLRGVTSKSVQFITAPNIPDPDNVNNVVFEQPEANELFSAIQHDNVPKAAKAKTGKAKGKKSSSAPTLDSTTPSKVNVQVLNGSGTQGIASQVGSDLTSQGFNVVGTGDALNSDGSDNFTFTNNVIEYAAASDLPAVNTLKAQVPNVQVQQNTSLTPGTIDLIVGSDFSSLNPAPSASKSTSPTPSVTSVGQADGAITANTPICSDQSAFAGPDS